ncbi:MAG TPA: S-layer homology domain-containing protein, partial [Bacillota bacterium]|nr:S-layer homology domain-containing protein [Bacillota bacterium]
MKRLKSLGVLALAFALLAASALPVFAASNAEFAAADTLYEFGLFKGTGVYPDGTPFYALDRAMTRQEAITMFVGLIGKKEEALAGSWTTPFTDVDDWAKPFVGYAYEHGLTAGVGPTLFGATRPVTQVQYLTFVLHALGYEDEIDFVWDKSLDLARQIGIADEAVEEFFRRDAVMASYRTLAAHYKNSENCILGDMDGKPADAKLIPMEQKGFLFTWQENGEMVVACYGADKTPKERYRVPAIAGDIKGATLKSYHREGSPTGWGYIYGPEGLYRTVEGKLLQISAKPAIDLCFARVGAASSGPIILSFDPEKPVFTVRGDLGGDRILEINEDGSESVR